MHKNMKTKKYIHSLTPMHKKNIIEVEMIISISSGW